MRSRGNIGGRDGVRSVGQCPACGRTEDSLSSGRNPSSASLDHLDLEAVLHELDAFGPRHAMPARDGTGSIRATGDPPSRTLQAHAHVHPEHADLRVVLHSREVGVVLDPEREVPARVETVGRQPVAPDVQRGLQERLGGRSAQGDPGPDRHTAAHAPIPDRLMAQGLDRLLFRHELEDLLGLHELLAGLAHADVHHDLLDPDLAHVRHGPTSDRRDLRSLDRRPFRSDDEHLPDVRGEAFRERDDVRPRVPGPLNLRNVSNLSDVLPRGHEDRGALAEFVVLHDLLAGHVDLQCRPGLVGVLRQDHVPTVMEVHLRLAATDGRLIFHATQLPRRVPGFDPDEGHAPARVDEHPIVRLRLVEGEDVHESDGKLGVGHHPAVDEDPAVVQDVPRLPGGVAELEHVAENQSERHALADRMRTGGWPDDPEVRLARGRPGPRARQPLPMLLHSARSSNFRRRQASVSSIRMISKFDAWSGLGTFFSSTFSIVMPSTTTVPCTRSTDTTLPSRPRNPPRMTRTVSPFRTGSARGSRPFAFAWTSSARWDEARIRFTWRGAWAARFR